MAGAGLVSLHHRPDLLEQAAILLNNQWPRSLEARKHSIEESRDDLPCSLLLVQREENERVIGYVRVLAVAGKKGSALVEALLVAPELRKRGLGRKLMEAAESHAKRLGYTVIHLSTHDQHAFYKHIGYRAGPAVTGARKCTAKLFVGENDPSFLSEPNLSDLQTSSSPIQVTEKLESSCVDPFPSYTPPPSLPPPPPPPPPPPTNNEPVAIDENNIMKWYLKEL